MGFLAGGGGYLLCGLPRKEVSDKTIPNTKLSVVSWDLCLCQVHRPRSRYPWESGATECLNQGNNDTDQALLRGASEGQPSTRLPICRTRAPVRAVYKTMPSPDADHTRLSCCPFVVRLDPLASVHGLLPSCPSHGSPLLLPNSLPLLHMPLF